jgi:hypothetical protein
MKAANAAAKRWRAEGKTIRFLLPDQSGADAADALSRKDNRDG